MRADVCRTSHTAPQGSTGQGRGCLPKLSGFEERCCAYDSDDGLSDKMWARIEPVLPREKGPKGGIRLHA